MIREKLRVRASQSGEPNPVFDEYQKGIGSPFLTFCSAYQGPLFAFLPDYEATTSSIPPPVKKWLGRKLHKRDANDEHKRISAKYRTSQRHCGTSRHAKIAAGKTKMFTANE
jgi:hypothetical protein